jgi:hypothetical protein
MPSDEDVIPCAGRLRSMTGLTEAALTSLRPPFEQALLASRQDRTLDGQPRLSRRSTTDDTGPLPTAADKRLFILTYVKQHPIQAVQGQLLGMSPSHAHTWLHLLPTVWHQA